MNAALVTQVTTLGSSVAPLFGIMLLWRRSLQAYVSAFRWQSAVLAAIFVAIGVFDDDPELIFVAAFFVVPKVIVLPLYLGRLQQRFGAGDHTDDAAIFGLQAFTVVQRRLAAFEE